MSARRSARFGLGCFCGVVLLAAVGGCNTILDNSPYTVGLDGEAPEATAGPGSLDSSQPVLDASEGSRDSAAPTTPDAGRDATLADRVVGDATQVARDASESGSLLGQGATCGADSDCALHHCVDGVCCDSACTGSCQQCNLGLLSGTCTPVPGGRTAPAPHPACAAASAASCGSDGKCDGKGNCELWPNGTTCGGSSCDTTLNQAVTGSSCDGMGNCKRATPVSCAPFRCAPGGTACALTCTTGGDCVGTPCVGGTCGTIGNGSVCTVDAQCTSTHCVDGYCCDGSCNGSCEACDLAGVPGQCGTVPPGPPHGPLRACSGSGACQGSCSGASASCTYPIALCAAQTCSAGMVASAAACDGTGNCAARTTTACPGGFACNATNGCYAACSSDGQCGALPYCNASTGACQGTAPLGHACIPGTTPCGSASCVDGVCCAASSCPACQSCMSTGSCGPSDALNGTACNGGGTCSAGVCACAAGQTQCSGTCADLNTDSANCGMCGTSCAGTCTGGRCLVTLASGLLSTRDHRRFRECLLGEQRDVREQLRGRLDHEDPHRGRGGAHHALFAGDVPL